MAASNGWGSVERDTSNGEAELGDGRPISLRGTGFPRGLGTHARSEIELTWPAPALAGPGHRRQLPQRHDPCRRRPARPRMSGR
ncbi:NPCBM/NEW2 domain-containing protein [Lentzea sp. NPDC051213]|uniref:NPCBM/NEW2 domain-containing protein n=1 Tax=Lentzea sp. NPDC051213 TaxID=3364126 RepID=UPI00379B2D7F